MRKLVNFISVILYSLLLLGVMSCSAKNNKSIPKSMDNHQKTKEIYFAGGCFWGTEYFFQQVRGVVSTEVGYANGTLKNPTYKEVSQGITGAAETVKIIYNPEIIDLDLLIDLYFKTIDPTSLNRQGNDIGTQYRTGIYYTDDKDHVLIQMKIEEIEKQFAHKIAVENKPLHSFYDAENYHQDYLNKNPGGYCHIPPDLFEFAKNANPESLKVYSKKDQPILKKELTELQYEVTQKDMTEKSFDNSYWNEFREGIYVDVTTGEPLFISTDKFESGCGWPSFSKPISEKLITELPDKSSKMTRTEVRSKTGDAHLGHVFEDGPTEKGGLRYCINSASLLFIPKDEMKKKGYEAYLNLLNK